MKDQSHKVDSNDAQKINRQIRFLDFIEDKSLEELSVIIQDFSEKYGKDAKVEIDYDIYGDAKLVLVYQDDENNDEKLERLEKEAQELVWLQNQEKREHEDYLRLHAKFGK